MLPLPTTEPPVAFFTEALGDVVVSPEQVVRFPRGLPGLPTVQRLAVMGAGGSEGVYWLACPDDRNICMLACDPFMIEPTYAVDLDPADLRILGLPTPADVIVLVLVTLPSGGGGPTANFYAPVALNLRAGLGVQLMPIQDRYGVAYPIPWSAILPEPVLTSLEAEDAAVVPAA